MGGFGLFGSERHDLGGGAGSEVVHLIRRRLPDLLELALNFLRKNERFRCPCRLFIQCSTSAILGIMAKSGKSKEYLQLLYQKQGLELWGVILFFRLDEKFKGKVKPYRKSHPFVIANYTQGIEKPVVYGSLALLLNDIKRLIDQFGRVNETWCHTRQQPSAGRSTEMIDFEYNRHVMDFTILLATYARNLFDLIRRFENKTISRLNYDNETDGEIRLRELFDTLIHNRYYYFDGTRIRDVFTSNPPAKRSLAGKFMGYGFDLESFGKAIWDIVHEIQLKDLTQLIRQRFKHLTINSKPQDIVFLIQNVESMSKLLKAKTLSKDYGFMRDTLFDSAGLDRHDPAMKCQPPSIRIAPDLSRKEFDIHFRYGRALGTGVPDEKSIQRHHLKIGYVQFLSQINTAFGQKKLISDFTPPKRHHRATVL